MSQKRLQNLGRTLPENAQTVDLMNWPDAPKHALHPRLKSLA
jgi:hypothetical protein